MGRRKRGHAVHRLILPTVAVTVKASAMSCAIFQVEYHRRIEGGLSVAAMQAEVARGKQTGVRKEEGSLNMRSKVADGYESGA